MHISQCPYAVASTCMRYRLCTSFAYLVIGTAKCVNSIQSTLQQLLMPAGTSALLAAVVLLCTSNRDVALTSPDSAALRMLQT
jgi:hypothetical protein